METTLPKRSASGLLLRRLTNRLHSRLLFSTMLLVTFQTALWAYIAVAIATPIARNQATRSLADTVLSAQARVDQTMHDIDGMSLQIVVDLQVQQVLEREAAGQGGSLADLNTVSDVIARTLGWSDLPIQIGVLGTHRIRYGAQMAMDWNLNSDPQFAAAAADQSQISRIRWSNPYISKQPTDSRTGYWIAGVRSIPDLQTGKNLGIVVVELRVDQLGLLLPSSDFAVSPDLTLFTSAGKLVTGTPIGIPGSWLVAQAQSGQDTLANWRGRRYVMVTRRLAESSWLVVGLVPWSEANRIVTQIERTTVAVALVEVCLAAIVVWIVSAHINRPLQRLLAGIRQVRAGHWTAYVPVTPPEEIAEICTSFNAMAEQIRLTMASLDEAKQREFNARLEMLNGQINAHFLFNALEVITTVGYTQGPDATARVTVALGKLLHYTLDARHGAAELGEEFGQAENYLLIQSERFEDVLSYRLEIDPLLKSFPIPRFSVQPLVENAVKHGVFPAKRACTIVVRAMHHADEIVVEVEDDGVGLPPGRVAELETSLRSDGTHASGIGLVNVYRRLHLFYGPQAIVQFDTRTGHTIARLRLPAEHREGVA